MVNEHFFVGRDEFHCDICGQNRFHESHAIGELDLPVERTLCRLEDALSQQLFERLQREHLLPFGQFGQPCDQQFFINAVRPMFHKYLEGLMGELSQVDGPLHGYSQIRPHLTFTAGSGFPKHPFSSDDRGLLCEQCGMVRAHALHTILLVT